MMSNDVSTTRLYLMRAMFLMNFILLGIDVWMKLLQPGVTWDPVKGAAYSLWAALSLLSVLGVRYPLQMLPLLIFQFIYKMIWLLTIALPSWVDFKSMEITQVMIVGAVLDVIVIPWGYVLTNYIRKQGDR